MKIIRVNYKGVDDVVPFRDAIEASQYGGGVDADELFALRDTVENLAKTVAVLANALQKHGLLPKSDVAGLLSYKYRVADE